MEHTQAAPVQPVSYPTCAPPSGMQQPLSPQQQAAQSLWTAARSLEQAMPLYQTLYSVVTELVHLRSGAPVAGIEQIVAALQETAFHHHAALGAIRRFLAGERTPGVVSALATSLHLLARAHQQIGPLMERMIMALPVEQRQVFAPLPQYLRSAESMLNQAGMIAQAVAGPQIWQEARVRVFGAAQQPAQAEANP